MKYQIHKPLIGEEKILYNCPGCGIDLESKMSEAGATDRCPMCQATFTVPGQEEVQRRQREEAREKQTREEEKRRAHEAKARVAAEQQRLRREHLEFQRRAAERARREQEEAGSLHEHRYPGLKLTSMLLKALAVIQIISACILSIIVLWSRDSFGVLFVAPWILGVLLLAVLIYALANLLDVARNFGVNKFKEVDILRRIAERMNREQYEPTGSTLSSEQTGGVLVHE
ncbi:MAG TPA: hypothetical protein PKG54_03410 [Phycisphaerae bacterium]|jgi:uncharacterized Zn finger protein (UPF0148 family)|nr:hypothetical protein [Phycisphaerae bacterium]HOB73553.1 hypothetical protein [Phycisphaerae bacterium]HOJ54161.1 hypothetical protein [Phycisphaerae bacterium]HOL25546.1 hypothetical protein [Phycisphaerae bacterium]HPP21021.1 hypothetical protein [Phycisphaerae bacterium]